MAKVYVTQETSHDFLPAEAFGEVVFLTRDDLHNIHGSLHNESLMHHIGRAAGRFDPDNDYVAIAGSPYVSAAFFMALGKRGVLGVNVLRWDNRGQRYIPIRIDLPRPTF